MDILPERGSQQATKGLLIAAEGGGGKQEIVGVGVLLEENILHDLKCVANPFKAVLYCLNIDDPNE